MSTDTIQPVEATVEIRVVAEPQWRWGADWGASSPLSIEEQSRHAEAWAKEFEAFVRDHRSQDPVRLSVERVRAVVCSGCNQPWDPYLDDEPPRPVCGHCGKEVGVPDVSVSTPAEPAASGASRLDL